MKKVHVRARSIIPVLLVLGGDAFAQAAEATCPAKDGQPLARSAIAYATYFRSKAQDAPQCSLNVVGGKIAITPATNPAMSCPNRFAWKLFAESVTQEFWKNWAADQQTWPGCNPGDTTCRTASSPLPLCAAGSDPGKCCDPASRTNPGYDDPYNPAKLCPYFPGDHHRPDRPLPIRIGPPPLKAHLAGFARGEPAAVALTTQERGRVIRQSMAELVFRNRPMWAYTFANDLYTQEGVANVFKNYGANLGKGAPYRARSRPGALVEVDFPVDAVMIKSNWINAEVAASLKPPLREDPDRPYVKMSILSPVTDDNGTILKPGVHWLVAFHISSKDIPNWVWATFEHVDNPGRCDYTGCNDSYGYLSPDPVAPGQWDNYTRPKAKCDDLPLPSWTFDLGKRYEGGRISESLATAFRAMGIGTGTGAGSDPTPRDRAWLSYRLKGAQTEFTDSMGRASHLGNSVTEGGFVGTSSCISCHARASTGPRGTIPLPLGVFVNELNEEGYGQSHNGVPVADWFHASGQPPSAFAVQTDFVWGFLFAKCLDPAFNPVACPPPQEPARSLRRLMR